MKYKNINAAAHNFCHSFLSFMNYDPRTHACIIHLIAKARVKGEDVCIDFLNQEIVPKWLDRGPVNRSLEYYIAGMVKDFTRHKVEVENISEFKLIWAASDELPYFFVRDNRGKEYKGTVTTHGD